MLRNSQGSPLRRRTSLEMDQIHSKSANTSLTGFEGLRGSKIISGTNTPNGDEAKSRNQSPGTYQGDISRVGSTASMGILF